ncbi:MAG: hypothetical protein JW953_12400 [Anaerolineae bacterium]|nr:hypothetical protein [Anaerolineae bacterium]
MKRVILSCLLSGILFLVLLYPVLAQAIDEFTEAQNIPTNGAMDWEFFTIDGNYYLAVANVSNGTTHFVDSKIYQWNGASFVEFQSIPTVGAQDWEFFTIDNNHYLVVANSADGVSWNLDSKIYRWNGTSFAEFQSIATNGAKNWEFFTIGSNHYLVVANYHNGSSFNIDSKVYRWNGADFEVFQLISTSGAEDWEFFTIGSDYYLAVTNLYNGSSYNRDSKIYRWDGADFEQIPIQQIPTNGATAWKYFTIGSNHYLAVANHYNGSTYNINSKIYQWNGSSFVECQSIATNGAYDWEYFTIGGSDHYLAVANYYNGATRSINSRLYRWNGASFVEHQVISTTGAADWRYFTFNNDSYLAVANNNNDSTHNINSKIYKASLNPPDLSLHKSVAPITPVMPGQTITYTLAFSNLNDTPALAVVLTDYVPLPTFTVQSVSSSGVALTRTTTATAEVFAVAGLNKGEGGVITISGVIDPGLPRSATLINTAVITGTRVETVTLNNTARAGITALRIYYIYIPFIIKKARLVYFP